MENLNYREHIQHSPPLQFKTRQATSVKLLQEILTYSRIPAAPLNQNILSEQEREKILSYILNIWKDFLIKLKYCSKKVFFLLDDLKWIYLSEVHIFNVHCRSCIATHTNRLYRISDRKWNLYVFVNQNCQKKSYSW